MILALLVSIIGIPDLVAGVVIGVVGLIVVVIVVLAVDERREARRMNRDAEAYREHGRAPADKGVIFCDLVDTNNLMSIAQQRGIEGQPATIERGSSRKSTAAIGAKGGGLRTKLGRERQDEERAVYEVDRDPNVALGKVLADLERSAELRRELEVVQSVSLVDESLLEQMLEIARDPEVAQAQEAVKVLTSHWIVNQKLEEYRSLSGDTQFVLVESEWLVGATPDQLKLATLRVAPRMSDVPYVD